MKTHLQLAALLIGFASIAGCHRAPEQQLIDTKAPAGFTFASSHSVEVQLSASAAALPVTGTAVLHIARPDGKVVYQGTVSAARPVHVRLSMPLKDHELVATLIGPHGQSTVARFPISGTAATYAF